MGHKKHHAKHEKEDSTLAVLDKEWKDSCHLIAEQLVSAATEEASPNAFTTQKKKQEINDLADSLSSHGLIKLLIAGFQEIGKHKDKNDQQFLVDLLEKLQQIEIPENITDLSNLASYLHIEEPLDKIEKSAMDFLTHGHPEQAAPLLAVAAFLQGQKPEPWFHLAFSLYQQENYSLAYSAIAAAQALKPAQPEYSILMAACLAAENEIEQAKTLLKSVQHFLDEHHLHLTEDWKGLYEGLQKILH
jgi:tetratricopeptide (TPR) repeat protein